jgi:hypothetical protein
LNRLPNVFGFARTMTFGHGLLRCSTDIANPRAIRFSHGLQLIVMASDTNVGLFHTNEYFPLPTIHLQFIFEGLRFGSVSMPLRLPTQMRLIMKSFIRTALLGAAGLVVASLPASAASTTQDTQVSKAAQTLQLAQRQENPGGAGFRNENPGGAGFRNENPGGAGYKHKMKKHKKHKKHKKM